MMRIGFAVARTYMAVFLLIAATAVMAGFIYEIGAASTLGAQAQQTTQSPLAAQTAAQAPQSTASQQPAGAGSDYRSILLELVAVSVIFLVAILIRIILPEKSQRDVTYHRA
ncbi:MAG: hypothetical protein KGH74_03205 [Candidatus Micrarchaeota archaeon]|nr:hypothetical protein [Candidatus Micrarchaeota archaeon]MDE1824282.1 hypothetical protein [Candidatus Micrarchaeota archaeon]